MKTLKIFPALFFALVTLFSCQKEGISDLNSDQSSGLNGARRANNCATCLPSWSNSRETFALATFNTALSIVAEHNATGITYLHLLGNPGGFTGLNYTVTFTDVSAASTTLLLTQNDANSASGASTDRDLLRDRDGNLISINNFPAGWEACDYITITFSNIGGVGFGNSGPVSANYYLAELCPPANCSLFDTETAYGGNTSVPSTTAWWFAFDVSGTATQTIWAGQNINVGEITYTGNSFVITLTGGWELAPGTESVKVQGFNSLPAARPTPGQSDLKGNSLTVNLTGYAFPYYAVHLDVQKCMD